MRNSLIRCLAPLLAGVALTAMQAADAAVVRLGAAEALTGPVAQYGISIRNGLELAVNEINAKGGINGDRLELTVEDDQAKKEEAINVFRQLIFRDKVLMIFGPTLSNSAFAADPIADQARIVVFGTSNTASGLTDRMPFVFRNSVMEADVLPVTVKAAQQHYKLGKVAVIYGNDDAFTKDGYDVFRRVLAADRIPVTTTETYAKGDVDFKAQLTRIKSTSPDAIVCSCLAEEAANIMLQARTLGLKQPFIGGNGFNSPKLFQIAKGAADGTMMGTPWSSENHTPANDAFMKAYRAKYQADPDQFAAQAYDAVHITAQAIAAMKFSGDLAKDRIALQQELPKVKWVGATGPMQFRPAPGGQGGYDVDQKAVVNIAEGGKFILMKQ